MEGEDRPPLCLVHQVDLCFSVIKKDVLAAGLFDKKFLGRGADSSEKAKQSDDLSSIHGVPFLGEA